MAKLRMQSVRICGLKKDQNRITEALQRLEVLEIRNIQGIDEQDLSGKSQELSDSRDTAKKDLDTAKYAIEILKSYVQVKEPFMLVGRKTLSGENYYEYENTKLKDDLSLARGIVAAQSGIKENTNEISQLYAKIESTQPWKEFSLPLNFKGTQSTVLITGSVPGNVTKQQLDSMIEEKLSQSDKQDIAFETQIIHSMDVMTYIMVLCMGEDENELFSALRMCGFVKTNFNEALPAKEVIDNSLAKIEKLKKHNNDIINDEIISKSAEIERLRLLEDYESMKYDSLSEFSNMYISNEAFVLTGYTPKVKGEKLKNLIESKFNAYVELDDADASDPSVPVVLKNNGYSNPLESVVEAYSLPGSTDVDPTFVISIFYYFMFGMMLSDAGYGLLIFAATTLGLTKFRNQLETGWKKTLKMYWLCGIFTMFWGVMFGSFFGDLYTVVNKTFFGTDAPMKPLWFDPVSDPMRLLTFALIIGIIHLFTGLALKGVQEANQKDYKALFADVIVWFGILTGSLIVLISTQMLRNIFGYTFILPSGLVTFGKYLAIASAVGIILTNGSSPNIGVRIGQGLYALYGISGYLSDVLSYSRLLALGLATGVIASVINMMGSMVAQGIGGILGAIVFVIIMVFGHLANFGINALGAYVHTNRLQYVELFGKFYDGGGQKFSPLKMNTKYYKFEER